MKIPLTVAMVVLAVAVQGVGTVDPAAFGLDPAAEPAVNAAALQKALDGSGRIGFSLSPGGHCLSAANWSDFLDFADRHLR